MNVENLSVQMTSGGPYACILADPPWQFLTYTGSALPGRSEERHYDLMTLEEIQQMQLPAADDCALFLWVVDSHLDQGLRLIDTWGFAFKTIAFVWVKTQKHDPEQPRMGMGLWTRKESEICLLATRGKVRRMDAGVRQVIMAPRREHSRKPDEIYGRIERLVRGPYLEMFARQTWSGWDSIGDEVGKFG